MNYLVKTALAGTLLLATACELYTQDDYEEQYVVESYLVANRILPQVRVSRTLPVEEEYSLNKAAINDADVTITLLDNNGTPEATYTYVSKGDSGIYIPETPDVVLPKRSYELHVTLPAGDEVMAQTLVPGSFEIDDEQARNSIPYQSEEQLEIVITGNDHAYNRQSYFIFTVNVIDPDPDNLTPFYKSLIEEQDVDIEDFYVNSSGIVNEENYEENPDGTQTLRLPWIGVAFYGENDVVANTIDDNMYDFLRYQSVQGGGTTLPPGEIQNIKYHVEGGIGIFGSMASDTIRVNIERQTTDSDG